MLFRSAAAVALAPLAAAFTVTVTSYCDYPVSLWNVLDAASSQPQQVLNAGDTWSGPFEDKTTGGGACIKLKGNSDIWDGGLVTQFEYKQSGSTTFYDLSYINGNIFPCQEVTLVPSNSQCTSLRCQKGDSTCPGAYYHPNDDATMGCAGGSDLTLYLCGSASGANAGGVCGGSSGPASAPAPAPAPVAPKPAPSPSSATTMATSVAAPPAPATTTKAAPSAAAVGGGFLQEGSNGEIEIVTLTTLVVESYTTTVQPYATDAADKRESHLHQHLRRGHARVKGRHAH